MRSFMAPYRKIADFCWQIVGKIGYQMAEIVQTRHRWSGSEGRERYQKAEGRARKRKGL